MLRFSLFLPAAVVFLCTTTVKGSLFEGYLQTSLDRNVSPCDNFYGHVCNHFDKSGSLHDFYFGEFLRLREQFLNEMAEEDTVVKEITNYKHAEAVFTTQLDYSEIVNLLELSHIGSLEGTLKYIDEIAEPLRIMFPWMLQSLAVRHAHRKSDDEMKADVVRIVNFIDKSNFEEVTAEYIALLMRPTLQNYFTDSFGDEKLMEQTFNRINQTFFGIKSRLLRRIQRSSPSLKKREFVMQAVRLADPIMDFGNQYRNSMAFTLIGYKIRGRYQELTKNKELTWLQKKVIILRASYDYGHNTTDGKMNAETILCGSWSNPTSVELIFTNRPGEILVIIPAGILLAAKSMDDTELLGFLGPKMGHAIAHTSIQYNVVTASRHPELSGRVWAIRRHVKQMCSTFTKDECTHYTEKDDLADFEGFFDAQEWFFEKPEASEKSGFWSNAQNFFYSMAVGHCGGTGHILWHSPVRERQVSPTVVRVNTLVSLNRDFRKAFNCSTETTLFPGDHGIRPIFGEHGM